MALYLGQQKVKTHLGNLTTKIKDNFTSLDWEYTNGEFLFSINNITPEISAKLSSATRLQLAVIRYSPASLIKRNGTKSSKTYPVEITGSSMYGVLITPVPGRMSVVSYSPLYKDINATAFVEELVLKDNSRFRVRSDYATERTANLMDYNWREYGFALVDAQTYALDVIIEARDKLRVKVTNQNITQVATEYNVISKKEIEVIN